LLSISFLLEIPMVLCWTVLIHYYMQQSLLMGIPMLSVASSSPSLSSSLSSSSSSLSSL
jgi:hypothetical protein